MPRTAMTPDGLDAEYRQGKWDFIDGLPEQPRQGAITAWLVACDALDRVLDVGCGAGNLCRYLLPHRPGAYLGIDLSVAALEAARRSWPEADFRQADFTAFAPPAGADYSAIVFNEVLSYAGDQAAEIARYRPFLRPGGVIVISMYAPARPDSGAHEEIAAAWRATEGAGWQVLDELVLTSRVKNVTWKLRLSRPS